MPTDVLGSDERVRVAKSVRPPVVGRDPQRSNSTSIQRKPLNSASEGDSDPIGASLLGHITVTELWTLMSDQRLSSILNPVNTLPGLLKTLFVNEALRSMPGLLDKVCGVIAEGSEAMATFAHYPDFKAWILEGGDGAGSFKTPRSSFEYASCTWRGKFLGKHKRLRAISAIYPQNAAMGRRHQVADPWQSTPERTQTYKREAQIEGLAQPVSALDQNSQAHRKNSYPCIEDIRNASQASPPPPPQLIDLSAKDPAFSPTVLAQNKPSGHGISNSSSRGFFD
jgi:hypothetical protein